MPVIFIIWDIVNKIGYWTDIQSVIRSKVATDPTWLENKSGAKEPTRKIHVSMDQIISENNLDFLKLVIEAEWRNIEQGKRHFEILYQASVDPNDNTLSFQLPPIIKRQLIITELQAFVTANPDKAQGWLDLATIYYNVNNIAEALKAINRGWSLDPENKNIRQERACILAEFAIRNGRPASMLHEAINLFRMTRSDPNDPMADYNIGNCYSELGQFQEAVNYYDRALTTESEPQKKAQIWTNRGNAIDEIGDTQEAVRSFNNAIKLNSIFVECTCFVGGSRC